MGKGQKLYKEAKRIIPGGTQLLSKRPEMLLPDLWPAYYSKARGCEVWDLDNNKYIDMSYMGIGSCILGYADKDVNKAVKQAVNNGSMSTLNAPEEVELAKLLCGLHPWARMVRYARCGGESMAIAVRIARAAAKKDVILFCGYHGWHDWYLAANLASNQALNGHLIAGLNPLGVPRKLKGTSYPFKYNDTESFLRLVDKYRNKIGVIIMEPIRSQEPDEKFIQTINKIAKDLKAVLVIDEITAGFKLTTGGAHLLFGLEPDIAVFAKAMSNGFPMAAIIGKEKIMQVAQETFISSTYWTDRIGPVAALATIKKIQKNKVPQYLIKIGKEMREGWKKLALCHGLKLEFSGILPLGHFSFQHENPIVLKTLFTQLMLEEGFLATTAFFASYSHKEEHMEKYFNAVDKAFSFLSRAIKEGNPKRYLKGPVCHSGFQRLT
ncbi:MAG: aminotransferase class III-fold pyridoxal phosphate-dependent enzyme [Candidatus Omnitrophota bacterium]